MKHTAPDEAFTEALLTCAEQAYTQCGCRVTRFLQNVKELGGVDYAKSLLSRHRRCDFFDELADHGHLEYSMEAVLIQGRFASLFTDDEVNDCLSALLDGGFFDR